MNVIVKPAEAGGFEVVKLAPQLIGTFPDEEMAQKFALLLMNEDNPGSEEPAPEVAPAQDAPKEKKPKEETSFATAERRKPSPPPTLPEKAEVAAAIKEGKLWTEDELDRAFSRLAAGENLTEVAKGFGKSWKSLRGKWASYKKRISAPPKSETASPAPAFLPVATGETETPLEMVSGVLTQMKDQKACNLCGKYFNLTPDNLDTCQRCSNAA